MKMQAVYDALSADEARTNGQVRAATGMSKGSVCNALGALQARGLAQNVGGDRRAGKWVRLGPSGYVVENVRGQHPNSLAALEAWRQSNSWNRGGAVLAGDEGRKTRRDADRDEKRDAGATLGACLGLGYAPR